MISRFDVLGAGYIGQTFGAGHRTAIDRRAFERPRIQVSTAKPRLCRYSALDSRSASRRDFIGHTLTVCTPMVARMLRSKDPALGPSCDLLVGWRFLNVGHLSKTCESLGAYEVGATADEVD